MPNSMLTSSGHGIEAIVKAHECQYEVTTKKTNLVKRQNNGPYDLGIYIKAVITIKFSRVEEQLSIKEDDYYVKKFCRFVGYTTYPCYVAHTYYLITVSQNSSNRLNKPKR